MAKRAPIHPSEILQTHYDLTVAARRDARKIDREVKRLAAVG